MSTNLDAAPDTDFNLAWELDAPREQVWQAWTEPARMERWWGPEGFSVTVPEHDLRPGGRYRMNIRMPDGSEFPISGEFREVVSPERLVYTDDCSGDLAVSTIVFEDFGGRTRVSIHMRFASVAVREMMLANGMREGWASSLGRLVRHLAEEFAIVVSREFDAPPELVFDVWTDPVHISNWWGPNGFTTTTHEHSLRVGGAWRFTMHGPDGTDYPNRIVYREILRPERLVSDHDGDGVGDSLHFRDIVTFKRLDGNRTRVTLRLIFPTREMRDGTIKFGAVEGGHQTLARLAEFLESKAR